MRTALERRFRPVGSVMLTAAAAIGTACLLVTVVAPLAGVRPLIFLSGSMSPTIPAGSLALARTVDAEDINAYLREITGRDVTAKDFRTWKASAVAAGMLPAPGTGTGIPVL